jgi:hypothetical protein
MLVLRIRHIITLRIVWNQSTFGNLLLLLIPVLYLPFLQLIDVNCPYQCHGPYQCHAQRLFMSQMLIV